MFRAQDTTAGTIWMCLLSCCSLLFTWERIGTDLTSGTCDLPPRRDIHTGWLRECVAGKQKWERDNSGVYILLCFNSRFIGHYRLTCQHTNIEIHIQDTYIYVHSYRQTDTETSSPSYLTFQNIVSIFHYFSLHTCKYIKSNLLLFPCLRPRFNAPPSLPFPSPLFTFISHIPISPNWTPFPFSSSFLTLSLSFFLPTISLSLFSLNVSIGPSIFISIYHFYAYRYTHLHPPSPTCSPTPTRTYHTLALSTVIALAPNRITDTNNIMHQPIRAPAIAHVKSPGLSNTPLAGLYSCISFFPSFLPLSFPFVPSHISRAGPYIHPRRCVYLPTHFPFWGW